jgi:uncharacterized protein
VIIDCHTHWGMVWQDQYPDDPTEWLKILDRHAVDRAFLYPHLGLTRLDKCPEDNDTIARVARRSNGRLLPVISAWPQAGTSCITEIRRGFERLGAVAVKFHPWMQGFSLTDPWFEQVCTVAAEYSAPIFFHDGTPCYSLSEQVAAVACRFPSTRIVLGHSGLLWNWRSAIEAARYENVWLCLCGPHMRAIEIICEKVAPDRLLWGSDFGFGTWDVIEYRLNILLQSHVPQALKEQILHTNPARLIEKVG